MFVCQTFLLISARRRWPKLQLEAIILRSLSEIIRVCIGIFTATPRNKKIQSNSHLTSTVHRLLSDCFLS